LCTAGNACFLPNHLRALSRVRIESQNVQLGPSDVNAFGVFLHLTALSHLHVGLAGNPLGDAPETVQPLVWLRFCRRLERLVIDVARCGLRDPSILEIAGICTIRELTLILVGNPGVSQRGVVHLSTALSRPDSRLNTLSVWIDSATGQTLWVQAMLEPRLTVHLV
jgi:hypothetical protein